MDVEALRSSNIQVALIEANEIQQIDCGLAGSLMELLNSVLVSNKYKEISFGSSYVPYVMIEGFNEFPDFVCLSFKFSKDTGNGILSILLNRNGFILGIMKRTQGDISDVSAISLVRLVRECRNGLRYNVTHCITICSEGLNKKTKREAYSNLIDLLEKNIS